MIIVKTTGANGLGNTDACRNSGGRIAEELKNINSNEKGKAINLSAIKTEEIETGNKGPEEQEALIYKNSKELLERGDFVYFLGGDHSISFPIGKAFFEKFSKDSCLIVFDSHFGCLPDEKFPGNKKWLRALVESGFPPENVLIVGARNMEPGEAEFLKEKKIKTIKMNDLLLNLEDATDFIMEFSSGMNLYLSINMNFVDPAFAPGVCCPEPGGASSRQALYIFSRLSMLKNLKALDIVEVNSENDKTQATTKLAGKILAEFL